MDFTIWQPLYVCILPEKHIPTRVRWDVSVNYFEVLRTSCYVFLYKAAEHVHKQWMVADGQRVKLIARNFMSKQG